MRLDFNYVVIDDDLEDVDDRADVVNLINKIDNKLRNKGFVPKCFMYSSKNEFTSDLSRNELTTNRIDLYLSDNNLGDETNEHDNDGIEIYLELKKEFICDFALYTRSDTSEIVAKMAKYLIDKNYPGLFSRFTFIPRIESNDQWHKDVLELLDHILTKREEMNNLRGLFAEKIAKIDLHLKEILNSDPEENFKATLRRIPVSRFKNSNINKDYLDNLRQIRNALLHAEETFDPIKKEFTISYYLEDKKGKRTQSRVIIYESECSKYRNQLNTVCEEILSWK